jgi:predicted N-acetyltransferase YhbS
VAPLNEYLHRYALQNQVRNTGRTYVATRGRRIVGYYTLVYGSVEWEDAPDKIKKGLAKYPVPILLLARLGVDLTEKGRGIGKGLLKDALLRAVNAADIAGLRAVAVQAKDDNAKAFYEYFGFIASPNNPYRLSLTIADIKANLAPTRTT